MQLEKRDRHERNTNCSLLVLGIISIATELLWSTIVNVRWILILHRTCSPVRGRDSSVYVVTGYWLDGWDLIPEKRVSLLHSVQTGSGAHPASIQWVPGALSPVINRQKSEVNDSPPSRVQVKTDVTIQDDPGGQVSVLGGHSICYFKQKNVYKYVHMYYERFPR
jgi:hypothetical protein